MTIYPGGPQDGVMYTMTAPDGSVATFNNPADSNYVGMAYFSGTDSPDIREAIDARAGADGSVQGLNFRGARPVVGTVEIVATSTTDRNTKFQKLKRAANALRADGTLDFTPDGGIASRIFFRLNGPVRRADERGWKYTVQFPMMSADPYIYGQALNTTTDSSAPFAFTATNQGDGLSAPTMDITVNALTDIQVSNTSSGQSVNLVGVDPTNLITWLQKTGTQGTGNGQFQAPHGVSVDSGGNVFVADTIRNIVQKFNSSGVYQSQIGSPTSPGSANGQFYSPTGLCHDASDNLFVCDYNNGRVQKFNSSGVYQAKSSGTINSPWDCCVDSSGNVYVTEAGNQVSTTNRFSKLPNTLGATTSTFGANGSGNGQFNRPQGIHCDSSNNIFVVDQQNKRVQKITSALAYSSQFSTAQSDGTGQTPDRIAIDSSNNMYVADLSAHVIQKYNSSGVYQIRIGSYGSGNGQLNYPEGLVWRSNKLYVSEQGNYRYQVFDTTAGTGVVSLSFGTATVRASNGVNLYRYVNVPTTQWWALLPGDNAIQVNGTGVTSVTMNWRDAWL